MNGRLLLAADVLYKNYSDTDLFGSIYRDQWILQLGSQYKLNQRVKLRLGYAFNENPMRDIVPGTIGGVVPIGGIPAIQYIQGQFAALPQHRLTTGIGVRDVMPGVNLDMSIGGMFEASQSFGATEASVKGYWAAFGLTWRFGNNSQGCETYYSPDEAPIVQGGQAGYTY
jgi:long-chain fatty acid transport protein